MSDFQFASERLEHLFPLVGVCARFGAAGNVEVAFSTLIGLHQQYNEHYDTLVAWNDRCAIVSDGQTPIPGWNSYYSSTHEAARAVIRSALSVLFAPAVSDEGDFDIQLGGFTPIPVTDETEQRQRFERLIAERGEEFNFDLGWVESLKERIRRERKKVIATPGESSGTTLDLKSEEFVEPLTDQQFDTLLALYDARSHRLKKSQISANANVSEKKLTDVLSTLAQRGLIDYDGTKRQGASITAEGIQWILASNKPKSR